MITVFNKNRKLTRNVSLFKHAPFDMRNKDVENQLDNENKKCDKKFERKCS